MPLVKREISPVNVSRGTLPPNVQRDELQCVVNGTLANLIRQLSSLSKHAEHIVGEIYLDAMKLDHKANTLQQRFDRIKMKVNQWDSNNEQASLGDVQMRKAFKSAMLVDQHTLDRNTLPTALAEVYEQCDKPPDLNALNPYRDDKADALTLYTDPSFFFALWRKEMLKECGDTKRRVRSPSEANKSPKKKKRVVPQANDVPRHNSNRFMTSLTQQATAIHSFPEEYQAPQALGLQLNRAPYQPMQMAAPPGMSVHAQNVHERHEIRTKNDFPLPDMSILAIDDEEDDLPPPPPPLMHTSIVQQIPSSPQNNIQYVPSENVTVIPPPPPPPPPPPMMKASANAATFAAAAKTNDDDSNNRAEADPRNDLFAQIRQGKELKKVQRAEEEEAERAATEQNDVAAILKKRMEHILGNDDESQSSNEDDGEWDD